MLANSQAKDLRFVVADQLESYFNTLGRGHFELLLARSLDIGHGTALSLHIYHEMDAGLHSNIHMDTRLPRLVGSLGYSVKLPLCPVRMQMQVPMVKALPPYRASIKTAHRSCQSNVKHFANIAILLFQPELMA